MQYGSEIGKTNSSTSECAVQTEIFLSSAALATSVK